MVQAIPTYAMSCFRLPKGFFLSKISSLCARFWWGLTETKQRIHWRQWKELCKPKELSGLNFRDLEIFNQALLAKQAWRVLVSPGSTVARVLKGRYFPTMDLLKAEVRSSSSYFWKGFVWGLGLLKTGLRKQIGDGTTVRVLEDPWIPYLHTFKVLGFNEFCKELKVSDCILPSGQWDTLKLRQFLYEEDVEEIIQDPYQ